MANDNIIITMEGLREQQERFVGKKAVSDFVLHLYTNDKTPSVDDVLTDYTEITGDASYSPKTLVGANFISSFDNTISKMDYPRQIFSMSSNHQVFGYFITTEDSVLLGAARFDAAPYNIPANGGTINVDMGFTSQNI